jgi:hypothetical protein
MKAGGKGERRELSNEGRLFGVYVSGIGCFRSTLGSLWGNLRVTLRSVGGHLGIIWGSLGGH